MGVWYSMTVSASYDSISTAHLTQNNRDMSVSSLLSSTMDWGTSLAHYRPGATCIW
jgi:hypothetical protein